MTTQDGIRLAAALLAACIPLTLVSEAQIGRSRGVFNPNISTEDDLVILPHISDRQIESIMEGHPFGSMRAEVQRLARYLTVD